MVSELQREINDFWKTVPVPLSAGFAEAIAELDQQIESGGVPGFKTGIATLDEYIRLVPQEYTLIGARSSAGKTALALQLIDAVYYQQQQDGDTRPIVMFSAEMPKKALARRYATRKSGIPMSRTRSEDVTREELETYRDALLWGQRNYEHVHVDETKAPTIEHMKKSLYLYQKEKGISLVVFDYVELAGESGTSKNENRRIKAIGRGLSEIAQVLDCPVVALSQLNRDIEKRADKTPQMSDIMFGGEQEPDVILLLNPDDVQKNRVNFAVAKNRNGARGDGAMIFNGVSQTFKSGRVAEHVI